MAAAGLTEEASSGPSDHSTLGGPRTSSLHPGPSTRYPPLLCRGDMVGGSMGAGKATASPYQWGLGGEPATPPSPRPPPAPAHHGPGTSSHSQTPPTDAPWQDAEWLQGQPQATNPLQRPRPPKGQPWASKGMGGQGWVVRMVVAVKLLPPLVARPPQPRVAGSAQPLRRAPLSPPPGPMTSGQRLPSPPPRWQCPAPSAPAPPPPPTAGGTVPLPRPSLGAAMPPRRAPSPGPSRWWAPPTPPKHLGPGASWAPRA